jgi:hypothetical protein
MRRGEFWRYQPPTNGRARVLLIVSSDGINDSSRPWLLGADVLPDDPTDILGVPVNGAWINAANLSRIYRPWLTELVGELDDDTRDRVDTALRAALDL